MPDKLKVFVVTEKWCDGNRATVNSSTKHMIVDSLQETGLATPLVFHYDEYGLSTGKRCDQAIRLGVEELRPDLLIYTPMPGYIHNPDMSLLTALAQEAGMPSAAIWWDAGKGSGKESHMFTLNIVPDSGTKPLQGPSFHSTWVPQSTGLYEKSPDADRPIQVSYVGSLAHKPTARAYLDELARYPDITLHTTGGQREARLPDKDYAHIFKSSAMSINFAQDAPYVPPQTKSRVFEVTMAGAMLLESENTLTPSWFTPGVDYVPFSSVDDLAEKIRYYTEHPEERLAIASSGHSKMTTTYSGASWWRGVFDKAAELHTGFRKTWEDYKNALATDG